MKYYKSYMNRQGISPEAHEKLLKLNVKKHSARLWVRYTALAACASFIIGAGAWRLVSTPAAAPNPAQSTGQFAADYTPLPRETDTVDPDDLFVVSSPVDEGNMAFYYMPAILYPDITGQLQADASRAYAPGSFTVDLAKEDIQKLLWGPEGIPETYQTDIGRQDLPWALFWDGYAVHGRAWYDGQGQLMELTIYGEKGRADFELELRLGDLPFTCCIDLNRGDVVSEFNGVEVAGWSKVYDRDGDGQTDYICGSEFMTRNDIGVRFTSQNNGKPEDGIDGEAWFNSLFVRQALVEDGGLYLDHLATAEHIPAWREETFSTLAQARQEVDFAPYLPTSEPEGYREFEGHLNYQEGTQNTLGLRWSKPMGYDNVMVYVHRDGYRSYNLVSPDQPESYDLSLYSIPWCDSVPEEHRETVDNPAFKAEDMSLSIVEARGREHDTGGMTYSFEVLHPDGTLVSYRCDGLTAEQVWAMVEETL